VANKITVSEDGNNITVADSGPQGATGPAGPGGLQPGDNISELTNNLAFTSNGEDVQLTSLGDGDKFSSNDGTYKIPPQRGSTSMRADSGTTPPPDSGKVRWDNATQTSATTIYLSETNDEGSDLTNYLSGLEVGDGLYFQNSGDAGQFQSWDIDAVVDSGGYKTITVTLMQSAGGNFSTNGQGQLLLVTIEKGAGTLEALRGASQAGIESEPDEKTDNALAWLGGADSTGILTGGEVTINVDPTKFDVAAGTGLIIDWQSPAAPVRKYISWNGFIAESIPVLAAQFTSIYIDANRDLQKESGVVPVGNDFRSRIYLQSLVHQSGIQIDSVSSGSNPAYEVAAALYDYVRFLGPLNKGNCFISNGANLTFDKEAGQTALPFINRANDPQNPTIQTDASISPVSNFSYNYRDGASGFNFVFPSSTIDPNYWDDGTGVLNTVTNNRFTIQRLYWFAQSGTVTVTYGQAEYQTAEDARAAILTEGPSIDPLVSGNASFTAALVVQEGATDLSDPGKAEFVCMDTL